MYLPGSIGAGRKQSKTRRGRLSAHRVWGRRQNDSIGSLAPFEDELDSAIDGSIGGTGVGNRWIR
jgi:hypothetical protein